jgi:hypothetical protein
MGCISHSKGGICTQLVSGLALGPPNPITPGFSITVRFKIDRFLCSSEIGYIAKIIIKSGGVLVDAGCVDEARWWLVCEIPISQTI